MTLESGLESGHWQEVSAPATPRLVTIRRDLDLWAGEQPIETYGSKTVLDYEGRPAFAELAILWTLTDAGWDGAWVDTFGGRYRSGFWDNAPDVVLPAHVLELLSRIGTRAGGHGGAFDVVAWRGASVVFVEAKRCGRDRLRASQRRRMAAAEAEGAVLLLVEWEARSPARGTGSSARVGSTG